MTLERRNVSGVMVVSVSGNITTSGTWAYRVSDAVRWALDQGHRRFLLDMRRVGEVEDAGDAFASFARPPAVERDQWEGEGGFVPPSD